MRRYYTIIFFFSFVLALVFSCKKEITRIEPELSDNPFDNNNNSNNNNVGGVVDSSSIVGIHKYILTTRCALSGCHDGTFEPDYRTVQSSYSTLVYHPIVKNNATEDFSYRVVPFDTAASVLYERITNCCFVNTNDRMPQDGTTNNLLPQENIDAIAKWIMNGAKDIFDNTPSTSECSTNPLWFSGIS